MFARGSRRHGARAVALLATLGLVGTAFAATTATAGAKVGSAANVLGTKNPAKGTPVKIGVISNGKTADGRPEHRDAGRRGHRRVDQPVPQRDRRPPDRPQHLRRPRRGQPSHRLRQQDDPGQGRRGRRRLRRASSRRSGTRCTRRASRSTSTAPPTRTSSPTPHHLRARPTVTRSSWASRPASRRRTKSKKVSAVAIDVPAATSFFKDPGPSLYQKEGLDLELIPVAAGTADMTPQMQKVASGQPERHRVHHRQRRVLHRRPERSPHRRLQGHRSPRSRSASPTPPAPRSRPTSSRASAISATSPIENPKDPSIKQYYAVLDKFGATDVDKSNIGGAAMFMAVAGVRRAANKGLEG